MIAEKVINALQTYCKARRWRVVGGTNFRSHVKVSWTSGHWKERVFRFIQHVYINTDAGPWKKAAALTHEVGHCIDFSLHQSTSNPLSVYRAPDGSEYVINPEVYTRESAAWREGINLLSRMQLLQEDNWFRAYLIETRKIQLLTYEKALTRGMTILKKGEHQGRLSTYCPVNKEIKHIAP